MLLKYLPVAIVATAVSYSVVHAQGRAPAENPPSGYAGQQYVDSRGCLFIRAGHGGQVSWVARIDGTRKPICGQAPSAGVMASARRELAAPVAAAPPPPVAVAAQSSAPQPPGPQPRAARRAGDVPLASYVPPPVSYGAPQPLQRAPVRQGPADYAGALSPAPAPTLFGSAPVDPAPAAPAQGWAPAAAPSYGGAVAGLSPAPMPTVFGSVAAAVAPARTWQGEPAISRTTGCPDHAPVGKVYPLYRGGTILICASAEHRLTGMRQGDVERYAAAQGVAGYGQPLQMAEADLMQAPAGYKPAWRDDRLNPNRARGTAQGQQQMLQIWTDKVPQGLRDPAYAQPGKSVTSSKSMPVARHAAPVAGARFVQVGSFGVPENAASAAARLQAMGLPVQISRAQIKGKPVQVVRAGPFGDEGRAVSALNAARGAGFGDAVLRR